MSGTNDQLDTEEGDDTPLVHQSSAEGTPEMASMTTTPDTMTTEEDAMATEDLHDDFDDRVDDMTKSILALDGCEDLPLDINRRPRGAGKYKHSLKSVVPIRFDKSPKDEIPIGSAGFFSLVTYSWMSSIMWKIFRKGITSVQNLTIGETEKARPNADRLERLWQEELEKKGPEKASFALAVYRAARTRILVSVFALIVASTFSFAAPAFILHKLLGLLQTGQMTLDVGIGLVLGISVMEFGRTLTFALGWILNYTTGVRIRGAAIGLLFRKVLRLRSLQDKTVGELVNLLGNDGQRIFESIAIGPLMFAGPVILLYGIIYITYLIGPWGLIASATFLAFYPFMYIISKLTSYMRRKTIVITDRRVRMMNELLTCIKLIKMYAWEKSFAKAISHIRSNERKFLEKAAFIQTVSTSTSPMVPVMAAVFTFTAFVMTGNDLTPVEAFTIISCLNAMRFSLGVLPFAVKALADSSVSFKRYKSVLLMEEVKPHNWEIFNDKYTVVLNKATFAWDGDTRDMKIKTFSLDEMEIEVTVPKDKPQVSGTPEERQKLQDSGRANGHLGTGYQPSATLYDITFTMEKGKLVGVCGSVGCGKSSLISAILGRMVYISGKVAVKGSIAYASQQAWIMNTTVRENILFGMPYEEDRYNAVVEACALKEDFEDFITGDETEIGERGINLSGGQKQRISLARAVYSDSDIYLLDDPLSAVDVHVGKHIFSECLAKVLKGKTILFVTHQLQYLSQCDNILFMKDGRITETGTHDKLMAKDGEYASLIKLHYTQDKEEHKTSLEDTGRQRTLSETGSHGGRDRVFSRGSSVEPGSPGLEKKGHPDPLRQMSMMSSKTVSSDGDVPKKGPGAPGAGKLMVAEEQQHGKVTFSVYAGYMKSAGGYILSTFVILWFIICIAAQTGTSWWLSYWLKQGSGNTSITVNNETVISQSILDHPDIQFYTMIYGLGVVVMVVTTAVRAFLFMKVTLHASSNMHDSIFEKLLASPMKFFDTTPVGRIINRFSADLDEVDIRLPSTVEVFLQNILLILFALAMISYVSLWFLIALVPLTICFVLLNVVFTSGVRELKRYDAVTRSPVLSHVTASVQGISTIHAYGKTQQFLEKFYNLMDKNSAPYYLFYCANRWLAVRLDLISAFVIGITGLLIVLSYKTIEPAMAGLALSFAIQMTGLFQFTIRQAIESEARFTSVQRLQFYDNENESEAPPIVKNNRPSSEWPSKGTIKFDKYKMRYRENLPYALKGISFSIKAQEKVGIVGRSGSGKSSLGVGLFRLVEPASGTIFIDDIDISKIGLLDLRSKLSIIPQDPVLFVGTVRYNLDPFNKYRDDELWEALEKCHIKDTIAALEYKLEATVVENGENFSVGERQLICMARALLRHSKIIMLDEATAAIDTETDSLVQRTIKEAFSDCTMLIIAHRLNTVLTCNRILVMEDGKAVEFGKPSDLLASPVSKFKAMLEALEKHESES